MPQEGISGVGFHWDPTCAHRSSPLPGRPVCQMGDFTFNYIFQKVINSSIKATTNRQALARQAWCHVTSHKRPRLLPPQIWGAQVASHSPLPSRCWSGPGSHPGGGCTHVALCVSDAAAAPLLTR